MIRIKAWNNLFYLLLACALLLALVATTEPTYTPKVQAYLKTLAATDPQERVTVIVQKQDQSDAAERVVTAQGGEVVSELPLINAFVAKIAAQAVNQLEQSAAIKWVALDAPMVSQNSGPAGALHILDDFTAVAYNGSDGALAWQSDWNEIGEADGADVGDVAVTTFWGGALQGLRLQGADKGVLRALDLTQATTAQVTVTYRRKSFLSENDYVILTVSADGGNTWTDLARWAGPATDDAIQNETLDLSAYLSAQAMLRLVTAPDMNPEARFYLDQVDVALLPIGEQVVAPTNRSLLPFVAKEGSAESDAALLDKEAALAQVEAAGMACPYYCINLSALQSTYAKAIRADAIWNVSPYRRGYGVTVAVVDSGISPHPDLNDYSGNSRVVARVNFTPDNLTPDDFYGHGTHIAGTIAGSGQSSSQAYMGIAPEAKLVDVKVMDDWGYGTISSVIAGLEWIYNNRATYNIKAVNLSLNSRINESYHESALNAALEVLWFNKITVVVSAGNGGKQRLYPPANDPFVITVGAADDRGTADISDDTLAPFSAYGLTSDGLLKPDLVAPGTNIVAPLSGDDNNLTWAYPAYKLPYPYNRYYKMSGTSMASAVVAGAVAVLLEDEPNLTPDQVKHRLKATARPFARGESCATGIGYLDLYNAVYGTTTASANTNTEASKLLWTGSTPATWSSVSWNSVSWNSVSWNSVSWNSVSWNSNNWDSVSWNSVSWNSSDFGSGSGNGSCNAAIRQIFLVDADTDRDLQPLYDGAIIDVDKVGTRNFSIRVTTQGAVESVRFTLNGDQWNAIDNDVDYALAGVANGDYTPYAFANGRYTLGLTTYTADNGGGTQGATMSFQFNVNGGNRCELEGSVRSNVSTTPMRLQIENQSTEWLQLYWLNFSGQRQFYSSLAPGSKWDQITYVTHPWLLLRERDKSCVRLIPDPGMESVVKITNSDLGANLTTDGSFESGSGANWGRDIGATVVNSNARTGAYALRIAASSTGQGAWQLLSLRPNTTYLARAYLKSSSLGNTGYLYINNNGVVIVDTRNQSALINPYGYTEVTVQFVTGLTSTPMYIGVWRNAQGAGDLYFDDLQVVEMAFGSPARVSGVQSNKALDVAGSDTADGANVLQWSPHGGANQQWRIEAQSSGGYQVVANHSNKCLDVADGNTAAGANVQQWSCNGSNAQRWRLEPRNTSYYQIVLPSSGKCLDVNANSAADGANVQQWSCNSGGAQQWRVEPTSNGNYQIVLPSSGKCLDVYYNSAADGANVQQWSCNGGAAQQWRVEPLSNGNHQIVLASSGKCLDVNAGSTADGANVQQWSCNGSAAQQWRLKLVNDPSYQLVALHSSKCLDVVNYSVADGANVQQWNCSTTSNQKWRIRPVR